MPCKPALHMRSPPKVPPEVIEYLNNQTSYHYGEKCAIINQVWYTMYATLQSNGPMVAESFRKLCLDMVSSVQRLISS